jgi:hypothetical protein
MFAHRLDPVCSGGSNIQGEEDGSMHAERIGRADTSTGAAEWSVEPRIRRVVVEHLGIGWEDLSSDVSLTEDLAADSLDLAELMVGLGMSSTSRFPTPCSARCTATPELVACVEALHRRRGAAASTEGERALMFVAVQIVSPADRAIGDLWRVCWCTPYNVETIVEHALSAGPGARLEARVLSEVSDAGLQSLEDRLAGLRERHIEVSIGRDQRLPIAPGATHPDAA